MITYQVVDSNGSWHCFDALQFRVSDDKHYEFYKLKGFRSLVAIFEKPIAIEIIRNTAKDKEL